jgi:hypothetical protein
MPARGARARRGPIADGFLPAPVRLAMDEQEREVVYYASMLAWLGCHIDAHELLRQGLLEQRGPIWKHGKHARLH